MAFNPSYDIPEERYNAAVKRNIRSNAIKGNLKRWLAEGEDHQELYDWLTESGEYSPNYEEIEENGDMIGFSTRHPLCKNMFVGDFGTFLMKLAKTLNENFYHSEVEKVECWGKLSPKQTIVVRNALARAKESLAKKDELEAQWAAEAANRDYVGEVGDKKFVVEGRIDFTTSWSGTYGTTFLTIIRDANDNTIKYKGKSIGSKGEEIKMIATIKAHEEYKGEKQTIVNRPRDVEVK